jgi:hypothetical protein
MWTRDVANTGSACPCPGEGSAPAYRIPPILEMDELDLPGSDSRSIVFQTWLGFAFVAAYKEAALFMLTNTFLSIY